MKQLTDFIVEIPDLVPKEDLDNLLPWLKIVGWDSSKIIGDIEDKNIRNCDLFSAWGTSYDTLLFKYASAALEHYKKIFPDVSIAKDTGYDFLRYKQGGFYVQHVDSFDTHPRMVSLSITFNDDYEGGDFSFFDGEHVIKTRAGSAILFPSNFMYPHAITPVTQGTRYSMVTWFI